jgi:hypothetical protein
MTEEIRLTFIFLTQQKDMDETLMRPTMKRWIPVALGGVIVLAYTFFYALTSVETQGATSIGVANSIGLVVVLIGLVSAGLLLKRATPQQ